MADPAVDPARAHRHDRQTRFAGIGPDGQAALSRARVLILGVGALGAACADLLCRAGVGALRLVDRDFVDHTNLQRQTLYSVHDADTAQPKAAAAAHRLAAIDPACAVEPIVAEAHAGNLPALLDGCDLALDGSDGFHTRHLLNEAACRARIPWIYGACVGAYGCSYAIIPGATPCLRCLQDQLPAAGDSPTCDTAGIIGPAVHLVAAWQVAEALKILAGRPAAVRRELWTADLWANTFQRLRLDRWRDPACAACSPTATWPLLNAGPAPAVTLCGRDAVQVTRPAPADLPALAARLGAAVTARNDYLIRWSDGARTLTCFRDGRVLVHGTGDAVAARACVDRWLG
jgi:molybdopterin/thiamine biosynthesis adenylyltransferase